MIVRELFDGHPWSVLSRDVGPVDGWGEPTAPTVRGGCASPELSVLDVFEAAAHDEVTGVLVRRAWRARAEREIIATIASNRPSALLMVDLDHFKQHNDRLGHLAGDVVLAEVVWAIRSGLRHVDLIGRYGGDELAVLLHEVRSRAQVLEIAERLRRRVQHLTVRLPAAVGAAVLQGMTVSVGGAVARPGSTTQLADLVGAADAAMYAAKEAGTKTVRVVEIPVTSTPNGRTRQ